MIKKNPIVSVIIPVYNGGNYLRYAIDSVLNQSYKKCEIIVVNDGSCDNGETEQIISSYGNKIRSIQKNNGGVSSALNYGIRSMNGDYFVWLSHDDELKKYKIEKQIEAIVSSMNEDVIAESNYEFISVETGGMVRTEFQKYYSINQLQNSLFPFLWSETHFSNLLFHYHHFDRVGLFDENNRTAQDQDMQFRLLRGQRTVFVSDVCSMFRMHKESDSNKMHDLMCGENRAWYLDIIKKMTKDEKINIFKDPSVIDCRICGVLLGMGRGKEFFQAQDILSNEINNVDNIDNIVYNELKHKNILIFGAGQYGRRIAYELRARGIKPAGFIDNDQTKHGSFIDGIQCYSVSSVCNRQHLQVIIGQKMYYDAVRQIKKYNIDKIWLKDEIDAMLLQSLPCVIPVEE